MAANEGLVVSNGVFVLVVLHEEHVRHVQLPGFVFTAELSGLAEDLLHHVVIALVPVDLRLHHQHGNVLVQRLVVFRERSVDRLAVTSNTRILNSLGLLAKSVDVVGGQILKLAVGLFIRRLVQNKVLKEFKISLRQALVGQVRVFCEDIGSQIEVRVLAVQEDQVGEGL